MITLITFVVVTLVIAFAVVGLVGVGAYVIGYLEELWRSRRR